MSTPATTAAPRGLKLPAAVRGTQNSSAVRSTQSSISLKGATVSGLSAGLYIDNYNMYDPKNGWVPDGYGNSASNPTGPDNITVLDTWTEFACDSGRVCMLKRGVTLRD
jgi:hypothetical protein